MRTGMIRKGCLVVGVLGCALQIASADVVCGWNFNELEAKQAELIGMTSVTESVGDVFSRAETSKTSFEADELAT